MRTLCVIPARAGSRGIPGKNLRPFCGVPLVEHAIQTAHLAGCCDDIVVSSDSDEALQIAEASGATALRRPAEYCGDDSPSELAMLHALQAMSPHPQAYDAIALLQCTSPLIASDDVAAAMLHLSDPADSVVTACEQHGFAWSSYGGPATALGWSPRQRPQRQVRAEYSENGALYATTVRAFLRTMCRTSGYVRLYRMPAWQSMQLDDEHDWAAAEALHRWQCGEV